jgi:hypothetical protein
MKKLNFKTFEGFDLGRRSSWRFFARQLGIFWCFLFAWAFTCFSYFFFFSSGLPANFLSVISLNCTVITGPT